MSNLITYEDISSHKSVSSLWVVIHGKAYDVTNFISEHPGGEEVLLELGGRDASEAFEDIGHSEEARKILEKYLVGSIDPNSQVLKPTPTSTAQPPKPVQDEKSESSCLLM